jgi:hypothetical protein
MRGRKMKKRKKRKEKQENERKEGGEERTVFQYFSRS